LNTEPQELYHHMKRAEEDENMTTSRLGLLTMIDGYNAKLGWQFESSQPNPTLIQFISFPQYWIEV